LSARLTPPDTQSPFGAYHAEGLAKSAWRLADWHSLPRQVRLKIRSLVARVFKGPYDLEADDLNFRIYPDENRDDWKILAKGRLSEPQERRFLEPYLTDQSVFVDLGANIGTFALFASRRCAQVVAVEANPHTAAKLAYNVAANGMANVHVVPVAVGGQEGVLPLWASPANHNIATLVEGMAGHQAPGTWQRVEVPVRPLSAILGDLGITRVDVMKIDVEGFEDRALLPYLRALPAADLPGVIMMEVCNRSDWAEDCLPVLAGFGYSAAHETEDNVVFVRQA